MARKSSVEQYVRPDTTRIGDTVRVTYRVGTITFTRVGTIAKRGTSGNRTEALTSDGYTLFAWAGSTTEPEALTLTLLTRTEHNESEYLF